MGPAMGSTFIRGDVFTSILPRLWTSDFDIMDVLSGHSDFVEMREPYSKDWKPETLGRYHSFRQRLGWVLGVKLS